MFPNEAFGAGKDDVAVSQLGEKTAVDPRTAAVHPAKLPGQTELIGLEHTDRSLHLGEDARQIIAILWLDDLNLI